MDDIEMLLQDAQRDVERLHEALKRSALRLGETMARLVERLDADGGDASVNELGEVQGMGVDVDRFCALLHAARQAHDLARRVAEVVQEAR